MKRPVLTHTLIFLLGLVLGGVLLFLTLTQGWLPHTRVTISTGVVSSSVSIVRTSAAPSAAETRSGNAPLVERALEVAGYIQNRDWAALAGSVHTETGVKFTPYSSVGPNDMCFAPEEIAAFGSDTRSYVWGYSDGSGEPMRMTPMEYFDRFVANADYTKAPFLGVNRVMGSGNAVENVADAYPDADFVELYYSGLDPVNEGFDWCALKLVFEEQDGRLMLVALIHSEWTI